VLELMAGHARLRSGNPAVNEPAMAERGDE